MVVIILIMTVPVTMLFLPHECDSVMSYTIVGHVQLQVIVR